MRLLVFFDIPTETVADRRAYVHFHRYLVKAGFLMLQESVYCKLSLNATAQAQTVTGLHRNRPPKGVVQILSVTEKQFSRMEYLVGDYQGDILQSDERLIEL